MRNSYKIQKAQNVYRDFIKGNRKRATKIPNQTMYSEILYRIFLKIFDRMMYDMYRYVMKTIGTFSIVKYLPEMKILEDGTIITNKIVNLAETKKIIKETGNKKLRVYYDNEETNGYIYKIIWEKSKFINATFYSFSARRGNRVKLKEEILAGNVEARVVDFKL